MSRKFEHGRPAKLVSFKKNEPCSLLCNGSTVYSFYSYGRLSHRKSVQENADRYIRQRTIRFRNGISRPTVIVINQLKLPDAQFPK